MRQSAPGPRARDRSRQAGRIADARTDPARPTLSYSIGFPHSACHHHWRDRAPRIRRARPICRVGRERSSPPVGTRPRLMWNLPKRACHFRRLRLFHSGRRASSGPDRFRGGNLRAGGRVRCRFGVCLRRVRHDERARRRGSPAFRPRAPGLEPRRSRRCRAVHERIPRPA